MSNGSIVFVHGTGVRLRSFEPTYQRAVQQARASGLWKEWIRCVWGDPLGVEFRGRSIPPEPDAERLRAKEQDFAEWNWLFDDPLFELYTLTIRDTPTIRDADSEEVAAPGQDPAWKALWNKIRTYQASEDLQLLLERNGYERLWSRAWSNIVEASPILREAFESSAHELHDVSRALARALVAEIHVLAEESGIPCPTRLERNAIVDRLLLDWHQSILGVGVFLTNMVQRAATRALRRHRRNLSDNIALPLGDILLYQSHGDRIRDFIRKKIEAAPKPVTVVAHSLGGIACFDLLALPDPPAVSHLVTAGSQAPLLYELGALVSWKPPGLPAHFPAWLNLYDRNDFLSYVAEPLFPFAKDVEVESGQPFPESHSAYFANPIVWKEIQKFVA